MTDALKELLRDTGQLEAGDLAELEWLSRDGDIIRRLLNAVREAYILGWEYGVDSERGSGNAFHSDLIGKLQKESLC